MQDYKYYNLVNLENKKEQEEINEKKNAILRMTNPTKKQIEWSKLFPKMQRSDDYLQGNVF